MSTPPTHYFSPSSEPWEPRPFQAWLAGQQRELVTAPGIFSPTHVDGGTAVLLRHAPEPPVQGTFLDVGCGWGPIALTLALTSPQATVWAVDVNPRCLEVTRRNAALVGCEGVMVSEPNHVPAEQRFDLIWSNPPVRIGKEALHELLLTWLPRLSPGGSAYLVVQKNLGSDSLQRWLGETLSDEFAVSRAASSKGFRVLLVHRAEA